MGFNAVFKGLKDCNGLGIKHGLYQHAIKPLGTGSNYEVHVMLDQLRPCANTVIQI